MKILYIEDDKIDQMAFKRFAERKSIDITTVSSIDEATSLLESQSFDFVLLDFFLGDGTAQEVIDLLNYQHIGVFCENDKCVDNNQTNSILYLTKPLDEQQFDAVMQTKLDLTYFNSLTEDDIDFKKEITTLGLQTIPSSLQNLKEAIDAKDFAKMKFEAHKLKSGVRVFGFNIIEDLEYIELNALKENLEDLSPKIDNVLYRTNSGLISLYALLENLE